MESLLIQVPAAGLGAGVLQFHGDFIHGDGPFKATEVWLKPPPSQGEGIVVKLEPPVEIPLWCILAAPPDSTPMLSGEFISEVLGKAGSLRDQRVAELADALRPLETIEAHWESGQFMSLKGEFDGEAKLLLSQWLLGGKETNGRIAEFTLRAHTGTPAQKFGIAITVDAKALPKLRIDIDDFNISLPSIALPDWDLLKPFGNLDLKGWTQRLADRLQGMDTGTLPVTVTCSDTSHSLVLKLHDIHGLSWAVVASDPSDADWADAASIKPKLAKFRIEYGQAPATLAVVDFKVAALGSQMVVEGVISGTSIIHLASVGPTRLGPLELIGEGVILTTRATLVATETAVVVETDFKKLTVRLADDPETFLAFEGTVELTPSAFRIIKLNLIAPYSIALVNAAGGALVRSARSIVTLMGSFNGADLDGLRKLLQVLGKFAAAMGHAAFVVGNAVADAAQSAARLVGQALAAIGDAIAELFKQFSTGSLSALDEFDLEVRLALDPFEIRQIIVTRKSAKPEDWSFKNSAFTIDIPGTWMPGLLIDFVDQPGAYLITTRSTLPAPPVSTDDENLFARFRTDLWLRSGDITSRLPDASSKDGGRAKESLVTLSAKLKGAPKDVVLVIAGLNRGQPVFLQRALEPENPQPGAQGLMKGPFRFTELIDGLDVGFKFEKDRLLPLLGMGETGKAEASGGSEFLDKLKDSLGQVVWIDSTDSPVFHAKQRSVSTGLNLGVKAAGLETRIRLDLALSLNTLEASLAGGDKFSLMSRRIEEQALGLTWIVEQTNDVDRDADKAVKMFELSFANGETTMKLSKDALMEVRFSGLSQDGTGVAFRVSEFSVGRRGVRLKAEVVQRSVRMNGLDVPFHFTSGSLEIDSSRLVSASIAGRGILPPALVGEADCTLALTFGQDESGIVLQSGKVEIDKKGDAIVCHSTRFTLTISDLDVAFQKDNGYHLYFLVTGSLRFTPKDGEFESGLLGFLKDVEINLERTPLTGDARVLAKHISFQKTLKPKKSFSLFNLFTFELRGFGFHPSSPKFDGDPAINLSGQIKFAEIGDVMQPKMDFHGLWIAAPRAGEALPRIKADGLGVDLQLAGSVRLRGSVLAVDPATRTVEGARFAPEGYNTYGFLGEGELEIPGWGAMQASMGFLEIERIDNPGERKKAFFLYLQKDKLAIEIPLPFWTFYIRELGFGFGFRYTVAGIKGVDDAKSPAQCIRILDDVSKRQGDLASFAAWRPDPEGDRFTLALRAAIQAYPAEQTYDAEREEMASNPFFFDFMVAIRSDLTLLASLRGFLGVNYHDFRNNKDNFRERPGLRGYLYISAPRCELLARMIGDSKGFIGERLPGLQTGSLLRQAVQSVDWSSTLYVRPGLFHYELGWPDQLAVRLVDNDRMKVSVRGGMIFRATGDGLLWGYNIESDAWLQFGGSAGGSIGLAVEGTLQARFVARLIAWLSWQVSGSLVYGLVSLDATLAFSVRAWMEVDLGFTSFTINISFSFLIQFSAAIELAITTEGLGGRVNARLAISVFGCTMGVGIGFSFNDGLLEQSRARVQRFMAMSITAEEPPTPPSLAAQEADSRTEVAAAQATTAATKPAVKPEVTPASNVADKLPPDKTWPFEISRKIGATDFWMVLHQATASPEGQPPLREGWAYALLVPREQIDPQYAGFYCSPFAVANPPAYRLEFDGALGDVADVLRADIASDRALRWLPISERNEANVNWKSSLPTNSGVEFPLHQFFDECFVTDVKWTLDEGNPVRTSSNWREPKNPRRHDRLRDEPAIAAERDRRRDEAQKWNAADAAADPMEDRIYQGRSTMLSIFLDQFVAYSGTGVRPDAHTHVLDLGLLFYGPVDQLEKLGSALRIVKADASGKEGSVTVFNPQKRWYEEQDPIFVNNRHAVEVAGVKLGWQLPEPWVEKCDDPQEDPQQFLHHYEIVRTIEIGNGTPQTFRVKPASTLGKKLEGGVIEVLPGDWQFVDDLADVDVATRKALLPATGAADALQAAIAWIKVAGVTTEVTLTYAITPVDIAGTRGLPRSVSIDIQRPQPPVRSARAEVKLVQTLPIAANFEEESLRRQDTDQRPEDLAVFVALRDDAWDEDPTEGSVDTPEIRKIQRTYSLVVETEAILPAGHYGSDGMTDRIRGLGTAGAKAALSEFANDKYTKKFDFAFGKLEQVTPSNPDKTPLSQIAARLDPESEERTRLDRWGLLAGATSPAIKSVLAVGEPARLLDLLWRATEAAGGGRIAARMWLQTNIEYLVKGELITLHSDLTPVSIELAMRRDSTPFDAAKVPAALATLRPEVFEWPVHLRLPPLAGAQVRVSTGFMHLKVPVAAATLADWAGVHGDESKSSALYWLRDPARRTLATVEFDAVPEWSGRANAIHAATIAGYDVYEVDIDDLAPLDSFNVSFDMDAKVWRRARRVSRIELLAPEIAQLTPATNSDWLGWQAHYPSETKRTLRAVCAPRPREGSLPIRTGWYSPRESTPMFAQRLPRLRLMAVPPDNAWVELVQLGLPDTIVATFVVGRGSVAEKTFPDPGKLVFKAYSLELNAKEDPGGSNTAAETEFKLVDGTTGTFIRSDNAQMKPADVRRLLWSIGWAPDKEAVKALRDAPNAFAGLELRLEAYQNGEKGRRVGTTSIALDFRSPLHSLLEEVLAELSLAAHDAGDVASIYRKYEVMVQPAPLLDARDFSGWLARSAPATDPYGWAVLQSLGHAATIRLFDQARDRFLSPGELACRVDKVFTMVINRWCQYYKAEFGVAWGQPFAEVLLRPGADCIERPFDMTLGAASVATKPDVDADGLSMMQLSLRPAPALVWQYKELRLAWLKRNMPKNTTTVSTNVGEDWSTIATTRSYTSLSLQITTKEAPHPIDIVDCATGRIYSTGPGREAAVIPLAWPNVSNPRLQMRYFETLSCEILVLWTVETKVTQRTITPETNPKLVDKGKLDHEDVQLISTNIEKFSGRLGEKDSFLDLLGQDEIREPGQIPHPGIDPFEIFPEKTAEEWAFAFGGENAKPRLEVAARAFASLQESLRAVAPELKFPATPDDLMLVASSYLTWAQRFLDQGAALKAEAAAGQVSLALAAPVKATPWRLSPDSEGRVRIKIPSDDKWAHARAYAIKPTSRYESLMTGLGVVKLDDVEMLVTADLAAPLSHTLNAPIGYAVAVTPRTERIEAPVVLNNCLEGKGWEVVLARHGEESLASSNRPLFARLGKPEILLSQLRSYRHPEWPGRLRNFNDAIPMADVTPRQAAGSAVQVPPVSPEVTDLVPLDEAHLRQLAQAHPSLWKGADVVRTTAIAPHYSTAVLVVARAGVVVSAISSAFQDNLPRFELTGRNDLLYTSGQLPRMRIEAGSGAASSFVVQHRLVSHDDVTPLSVRQTWRGKAGMDDVRWWPDPDVSYRLLRTWDAPGGGTINDEDADIRLVGGGDPKDAKALPVIVRTRGTRWVTPAINPFDISYVGRPHASEFQLATRYEMKTDSPAPKLLSVRLLADDLGTKTQLASFAKSVGRFAEVLVQYQVMLEVAMKDGETEDDYLVRMREAGQACHELAEKLKGQGMRFDVARVVEDVTRIGAITSEWFGKASVIGGASLEGRFMAWLASQPENRYVAGAEVRYLPYKNRLSGGAVRFVPVDKTETVLSAWDVTLDREVGEIVNSGLPFALEGARFWQAMCQQVTGGASKLMLYAIDGRMSPEQGVVMQQVLWPEWIEKLKIPAAAPMKEEA
ncbi:hypothetical protein [Nitrosospira sp. Nsp13]|uniref:hypothetical protein n=1 Tax=Nitrosospira sp. Nsp13 TaxID=1855332 RepID=UPI0008902B2B|nr:hypothetical protein [Nitrosospira sp. Nsp13]SCX87807.1 hypothetical protein SAMN05216308_101686 [Nitrosospira sp. Nsp13]